MAGRSRGKSSSRKATGSRAKPKSKNTSARELDSLRKAIDSLDRRIIDLLSERARIVVRVGKIKREHGIPIYTPSRESEVLSRVIGMNKAAGGVLPDRTIEGIYRELMSGSFRLERAPRIGFLGPKGSYSHLAAVRHFGTSVDFEDLHTITGVFTEVARGHVEYGLVPIENSIGGGIVETLEAFQQYHAQVQVYAEVQIEVHHALLANCKPSEVRRVYSKPEVFAQCRTWLATQYPQAELVPEASSSRAVKRVVEECEAAAPGVPPGVAAIGSTLAGELYGVRVLFENIEDSTTNITRFYVLSRHKARPLGKDAAGKPRDKTALMFATTNEPGALVSVLAVFHRAGINLTHIDKRPSGRENWQYTFFMDAEGHVDDPWFAAAVKQAQGLSREMQVLGSFPRSTRIL